MTDQMDVEALVKRLREDAEKAGASRDRALVIKAADALAALSADLSHWEARAMELERDEACAAAFNADFDVFRTERSRAEPAEARAKELELEVGFAVDKANEFSQLADDHRRRATALAAEVERYRIALDVTRMQLESIAPQHSNDPFHASAIDIARAALEGKDNG